MNEVTLDEIIIGSSIEAHLFSLLKNIPIISNKKKYFEFEHYKEIVDLDLLNIFKQQHTFKTSKGEEIFGVNKILLYNELIFYNGLEGRLLFGDSIKNIEHYSDNIIQCQTNQGKNMLIKYTKLYIFDNTNIINLKKDIIKTEQPYFVVYDFFKHSGTYESYRKYDIFYLDDYTFPNKIITYKKKKDKRKKVTGYHPVCISEIPISEINKEEYESYNLQLFIPELFEKEGFMPKMRKTFSLLHTERIKTKVNNSKFYSEGDIFFVYSSIKDLLDEEICDKRKREIENLSRKFSCH